MALSIFFGLDSLPSCGSEVSHCNGTLAADTRLDSVNPNLVLRLRGIDDGTDVAAPISSATGAA